MEKLSRRRALALLPAAGFVAPTLAATAADEHPNAKAERLRDELADALNDAWGGLFGAEGG